MPHLYLSTIYSLFFFFNATATTEIYTLSLHDALPILIAFDPKHGAFRGGLAQHGVMEAETLIRTRSEEHTSELQSRRDLVCRLLLEKKKKKNNKYTKRKKISEIKNKKHVFRSQKAVNV